MKRTIKDFKIVGLEYVIHYEKQGYKIYGGPVYSSIDGGKLLVPMILYGQCKESI